MSLPIHYCDLCRRQLSPLVPTVADRNQARHGDPDKKRVHLSVVLGALWVVAVLAVAAGLVAVAAWAVG